MHNWFSYGLKVFGVTLHDTNGLQRYELQFHAIKIDGQATNWSINLKYRSEIFQIASEKDLKYFRSR